VVVGQQIALDAVVTGATVQSQQWSLPGGTVVGGYNASTNGGGCVVLIQGQSSQDGSCTGSPVSTTNPSFAFYWVDSGAGSQQTVTYTYTATNGASASATATFNIDAPSGVTVGPPPGGQLQSAPDIYMPPTNTDPNNPYLGDGNGGNVVGLNLLATAGYLPAGGQYRWTQIIGPYSAKLITTSGPQTCTFAGSPSLDNFYPYPADTTHVTNDTTDDSPGIGLIPRNGEMAPSFNATMYSMWVPPTLTFSIQCPNGSACTIPVPQGNIQWSWSGDGIDTLSQVNSNGLIVPQWIKYNAWKNNTGFVEDDSFPTWTTLWTNQQYHCVAGR
jgi:hypothetical protein